jgi:hypothetical protein
MVGKISENNKSDYSKQVFPYCTLSLSFLPFQGFKLVAPSFSNSVFVFVRSILKQVPKVR